MWFNESAGPDPYKSHFGRKTSISNRHKHGVRQFDDQRAGERGHFKNSGRKPLNMSYLFLLQWFMKCLKWLSLKNIWILMKEKEVLSKIYDIDIIF